ncbi:uncharacterized protein [Porites lutea]|uniref:uncharacterized protein n=1 Tax=Porites lutea TaxID=51062 RepID=UPI003CC69FE6
MLYKGHWCIQDRPGAIVCGWFIVESLRMQTKKTSRRILLVVFAVAIFPTVRARFLCFCNSPSCPQAVCESSQRCFTKLRKEAKDDGNVSSSILYGCSEELNSSDVCTESSFMLCCDRQLCNMPNMLRKVTNFHQRRYALHTAQAPKVNKNVSCACSSSSPAMRVASVAAPSVLILTVVLLSLAMCRKMSHYQRKKSAQMKSNLKLKDRGSSEDLDIPQFVATRSTSMSSSEYKELVSNPYSV